MVMVDDQHRQNGGMFFFKVGRFGFTPLVFFKKINNPNPDWPSVRSGVCSLTQPFPHPLTLAPQLYPTDPN